MEVKSLRPLIIGGGNLGGAVARGLFRAGVRPLVVQHRGVNFDGLQKDGIEVYETIEEALPLSGQSPVFLALKPWLVCDYCAEHRLLLEGRVVVSCAALVSLSLLREAAPSAHWGRVMPNIASAVGAGFTGVCRGDWSEEELQCVCSLCGLFGDMMVVAEKDLDGIIGLSGSSIAYVFELLEGFMQGGLAVGMKGDLSLRAGIATLAGAAALARESGRHPAELKDSVCTPGGTTIAGIRALQRSGFRSSFIEALVATVERSQAGSAAFLAAARREKK